jgi:hypothetical protein
MTGDGTIQVDGSTELLVQGIISDPGFTVGNFPTGSRYSYHVIARFEGANGSGNRVELRPCTFTALKLVSSDRGEHSTPSPRRSPARVKAGNIA